MAAPDAPERGLVRPVRRIDHVALGALLRRVGRRYLHDHAAVLLGLVVEEGSEHAPARPEDTSVQTGLLGYVGTRVFGGTLGRASHVLDVQVFQYDDAVVLGVVVAEDVGNMLSLATCFPVGDSEAFLGLCPVLGPLSFAVEFALSCLDLGGLVVEHGGPRELAAFRVGDDVGHAAVHADRATLWHLVHRSVRRLATHGQEPLVHVSGDGRVLDLADVGPVQDGLDVADLGEGKEHLAVAVDEPKSALVGRVHAHVVAALSLEFGLAFLAGEVVRPCVGQVVQNLVGCVSHDLLKPRDFCAECRELLGLVEGGGVDAVESAPGQPGDTLFVGEVPDVAQTTLPLTEANLLVRGGVDAVLERRHGHNCTLTLAGHNGKK